MTNFKQDILQITTRLIVEEGFNYSEAKQKAGSMLKPNKRQKTKLNNFPTNLEIEKSVKVSSDILSGRFEQKSALSARNGNKSNERVESLGPILIGELSRDIATEYTILHICVFPTPQRKF